MVLKLKRPEADFVAKAYQRAMKKLNDFFGINWTKNIPRLFIVEDRKMINDLMGWDTPGWLVAWGGKPIGGTAYVYILDPKNYEKESDKEYSKEKYEAMIAHELAHCFTDLLTDAYRQPIWLSEGISEYLAGQLQWRKKPKKLESFLEFFDQQGPGAYSEGGFVAQLLIDKYGKKKLFELLGQIKSSKPNQKEFANMFEKIYRFEPSYQKINQLFTGEK